MATTMFYGMVGYSEGTSQTSPGVYVEQIIERPYYGNIIRNSRRLENGDTVNDNISVGNSISIIVDAYALNHFFAIRYVSWAGTNWKVSEATVQEGPRLTLRLGEVYNGPTASITNTP